MYLQLVVTGNGAGVRRVRAEREGMARSVRCSGADAVFEGVGGDGKRRGESVCVSDMGEGNTRRREVPTIQDSLPKSTTSSKEIGRQKLEMRAR